MAYADAERRDAARGADASHLVDQRRGQAGAAATKRVTDRNRAAIDVQFCVVDAQLALAGEGLRGERLVQLEQVDAVEFYESETRLPCRILCKVRLKGMNRRQNLNNFTSRGRSLIGIYNVKLGPPFPSARPQVPIPLPGKRNRLHFKHA